MLTFSTDGGENYGAWAAETQANATSQLLFAYLIALCKRKEEVLKALLKDTQSRNASLEP